MVANSPAPGTSSRLFDGQENAVIASAAVGEEHCSWTFVDLHILPTTQRRGSVNCRRLQRSSSLVSLVAVCCEGKVYRPEPRVSERERL